MDTRLLKRELLTLAAFTLLAVLYTYPLILHFNTHVIGPYYGDNLEFLWRMWWIAKSLYQTHTDPFYNPDVYYPNGYNLAYSEITPFHTVLLSPLTHWLGEIPAYNLMMLFSFISTGWFMYLLARRWLAGLTESDTKLYFAAFFCGVAFMLTPYRMTAAIGHINLAATQWISLAFFGLDRWLETRRVADAILLAVGISLAALSSWYYLLMLAFAIPIYVIFRSPRHLFLEWRSWANAALVGSVVTLVCIPFLLPYMKLFEEGSGEVPLDAASFWAASPFDYTLPNPLHPIWGKAVQFLMWPIPDIEMPREFIVTPGWVILFLGLWGWRKVDKNEHWTAIKWVAGIAFILSLGPYLHLGRLPLGIPLPVLLLREIMPAADGIQSWGRFSIIVSMCLQILAGAGLLKMMNASVKWRRLAAIALIALLFSLWPGAQVLIKVEPRPVDRWLAEQESDFAIMQYPIDAALSGASLYYTRYHEKKVVFGYGTYFNFLFRDRHADLKDFPDDVALDKLQSWDVHYILVQTDSDAIDMDAIEAQPRLKHIITLDNQAVFELID